MPIGLIVIETTTMVVGCGIVAVVVNRRVKRGAISRKEKGLAWVGASLAMSSLWMIGKPWLPDVALRVLLALNVLFAICGAFYVFWPGATPDAHPR
jgi:hypothetical protein